MNRLTDVDIPRSAWSAWKPDVGERQLHRALVPAERQALETRMAELLPAVEPFSSEDMDRSALALTDMFGSFPSMRQGNDEAVARIDSALRLLAPYPAWAIERACRNIQTNGTSNDLSTPGNYKIAVDRRWPPSDAEIVQAVKEAVKPYADSLQSAQRLLGATVEVSSPAHSRPHSNTPETT